MPHLDEGRLTLLLDGELTAAERGEAEHHLAGCADCRRLLAELRELASEAARLVATVEPAPRPAPAIPPRRVRPWERWRPAAWAATVVLAAGLGWYASGSRLEQEAEAATSILGRAATEPAGTRADSGSPTAPRPSTPPVDARSVPPSLSGQVGQAEARRERAPSGAGPVATPDRAAAPDELQAKANLAAEADRPAEPAALAPSPQADARARQAAPREEVTSRQQLAPAAGAAAGMPVGLETTTLESAVRLLGGSVRLLDGFTPAAVRVGPGRLVPGADPSHPVVRIVYLDPPGREMWLDQQRISAPESGLAARSSASGLLTGDTVVVAGSDGLTRVRWRDGDEFHLALTGRLSGDSLRILARRVR